MLYHAVGNAIVTGQELLAKSQEVANFHQQRRRGKTPTPVEFSTGRLDENTVAANVFKDTNVKGKLVPFQEIGMGKPLTIMIRRVYVGKYPERSWVLDWIDDIVGRRAAPMLVTSAIKSFATYDAVPPAVNFMAKSVTATSTLDRPEAQSQGVPLIFYSPAVVDRDLTIDIGMVFDNFPVALFATIGSAVQSAAGLPVFIGPQAAYLLAAGQVIKLAGRLGEKILKGKYAFQYSGSLPIEQPGAEALSAGFKLLTDERWDKQLREKLAVNLSGEVIDANSGQPYNGDMPYIVISCDGRADDKLVQFTPTAASAAILSRFFGSEDADGIQTLGILRDALDLYNDFTFRRRVDDLDAKIAQGSKEENAQLKQERDALVKNIRDELLRPNPSKTAIKSKNKATAGK